VYSGFMAVSDAAAFTVLYVFIVEVLILRDIKIKNIPKIMKESMVLVGAILIIISCSQAATNYVIDQEIPKQLFGVIKNYITNKWVFLIVLNIFLLITGSFLELFASLVILVPLITPIAREYNINMIHLGIIFLANLEIGFLLPPFGLNLLISSLRFNRPVVSFIKPTIKFLILSVIALIMITYIPEMSTWFIDKPSVVGQWDLTREDGDIDRFVIKAGGIYFRKKGSLADIMMEESAPGKYVIKNNVITFTDNKGTEEYKFEIFNDGEKILLESKSGASEKLFYKNQINPPFENKSGRLICKWTGKNIVMDFHFNGDVDWSESGNIMKFRYYIKNGKLFLNSADDSNPKGTMEYKFKFDKNKLILSNGKNLAEYEQAETTTDY
jgi:hypothetical protein